MIAEPCLVSQYVIPTQYAARSIGALTGSARGLAG
jgi:hypothetical protein